MSVFNWDVEWLVAPLHSRVFVVTYKIYSTSTRLQRMPPIPLWSPCWSMGRGSFVNIYHTKSDTAATRHLFGNNWNRIYWFTPGVRPGGAPGGDNTLNCVFRSQEPASPELSTWLSPPGAELGNEARYRMWRDVNTDLWERYFNAGVSLNKMSAASCQTLSGGRRRLKRLVTRSLTPALHFPHLCEHLRSQEEGGVRKRWGKWCTELITITRPGKLSRVWPGRLHCMHHKTLYYRFIQF